MIIILALLFVTISLFVELYDLKRQINLQREIQEDIDMILFQMKDITMKKNEETF